MTAEKITDDQVREAHREYLASTDPLSTIAAGAGVSESTLSHRFRMLGLPPRFTRSRWTYAKTVHRLDPKSWHSTYVRYLMTMEL